MPLAMLADLSVIGEEEWGRRRGSSFRGVSVSAVIYGTERARKARKLING